jgi:hypothetical protein
MPFWKRGCREKQGFKVSEFQGFKVAAGNLETLPKAECRGVFFETLKL